MSPADANEAANRRNHFTQAVIGAKEGAANGIKAKVAARIADTVLQMHNGTDDKGIDDFEIYKLMQAIHQHAERPKLTVLRALLVKLAGTQFDFRRYVSSNVTDLRTKAGQLDVFKTSFPKDQVAVVILANVK